MRSDNAVVKIDEIAETLTAKPWLPNYRGWIAYGPGDDNHNCLCFKRRNSRFSIPRKFKTAKAAMEAVDRDFPEKGGEA